MTPEPVSQMAEEQGSPQGPGDSGRGAKIIDLSTRNALDFERPRPRSERLGMIAGLAVVVLLAGMTVWTIQQSQDRPGRPAAARTGEETQWLGKLPLPGIGDERRLAIDLPMGPAPMPEPASAIPASPLPPPDLSPVLANPGALPEITASALAEPSARPPAGPTVVFESGPGDSGVGFAFEQGEGKEFGGAIKPERSAPAKSAAGKTAPGTGGDALRTLGRGTLIPAILETAIDSKAPGGVRAVVSTDVLSSDGKRSLVPRSSRLVGQYKTRRSSGLNSAYVVWTQIQRPDGVRIDIPSNAAGASERQFFERFGTARLVSVIAGQSGADLRARQGEPVRVMAARDVDLSQGR